MNFDPRDHGSCDRDTRDEDIEVPTIHYRGAHGSAAARSGFTCYGAGSARTGRGRSSDPRLAEELLKWPSRNASKRSQSLASPHVRPVSSWPWCFTAESAYRRL